MPPVRLRRGRLAAERLEPRDVPAALTLTVAPTAFGEGAGAAAATATVTRTGDLSAPLTVGLSTSDPTEATVPASVTLPAGQASATVPVAAVDDLQLDGPQAVAVRAAVAPAVQRLAAGGLGEWMHDVAVQPDGKIVTAGSVYTGSSTSYDGFVARFLPDGSPDPTFGVGGRVVIALTSGTDQFHAVAIQPDGKIVAAGDYSSGFTAVRLTPAGALDPAFGSGGKALTGSGSTLHDLALQPDGKVLLAGAYGNSAAVVRLTAAGQTDTGFGYQGTAFVDFGAATPAAAHAVAVGPDGGVYLAGQAGDSNTARLGLAKLTTAGQPDAAFGFNGSVATDVPGWYDAARDLAVLADGRVVLLGQIRRPDNATTDIALARYTAAGILDPTFGPGGVVVADLGGAASTYDQWDLEALADGRLLVGAAAARSGVALFSPGGGLLSANLTATDAPLVFIGLALTPNGTAVVAGRSGNVNPVGQYARFDLPDTPLAEVLVTVTDDEPDLRLTVSPAGLAEGGVATATLTRSGGDLGAAYTVTLASSTVGRVTVPATATFAAGQTALTFPATAVANSLVDGDEDVLLSAAGPNAQNGQVTAAVLLRVYDDDGSPAPLTLTVALGGPLLEHDFAAAGTGTVTRSGGYLNQPLAVSLSVDKTAELAVPASVTIPAGQTSATFPLSPKDDTAADGDQAVTVTAAPAGPSPGVTVTGPLTYRATDSASFYVDAVAVQADGKVVSAGTSAAGDFVVRRAVPQSNGGFLPDPTWGTAGETVTDVSGGFESVVAVASYPDGRVLVVGTGPGGAADVVLARYTALGQLDPAFDGDGRLALDLGTRQITLGDVAVAPDGKIVLAVTLDRAGTYNDMAAVRLLPDGGRDAGFGTAGVAVTDLSGLTDWANAVAVLPDGRVLVAGESYSGGAASRFALVRFTAAGGLDPTFDGDGRAEYDLSGFYEGASDVIVRPDGRVVLAGRMGRTYAYPSVYDPVLVQLTAAGGYDPAFGVNGVSVLADAGSQVTVARVRAALQPDGRLVVADTLGSNSAPTTRVVRVSPAGSPEHATLGTSSAYLARDLAVSGAGDVYLTERYYTNARGGPLRRYTTPPTGPAVGVGTVTVRDNEPFAVAADSYTVATGATLTATAAIGVRANDTITRPISPAVEVVTPPAVGTLALDPDGGFRYTPPLGFYGTATFTYRLRDGTAVVGPATVTVQVTYRPLAFADAFTLDEDSPLTVGLVPPATAELPARFGFDEAGGPAVNGGSLAVAGTFAGAATRAAGGVGRSAAALDLSAGTAGYVTAGDLDALDGMSRFTVAGWVKLTANPQPGDVLAADWSDTPVPAAGRRGWSLTVNPATTGDGFTPRFNLHRANANGTVTNYTAIGSPQPLNAWVFVALTFDTALASPYGAAQTGSMYLGGATAPAADVPLYDVFGYPPVGPNDAPLTVGGVPGGDRTPPALFDEFRVYARPLSAAEVDRVWLTTARQFGVLGNDYGRVGEPLTAVLVSGPAHGQLALAADGGFTYTPDPDYFGTDSFTYRAADGAGGLTDPATVTLTVRPRPDLVGPPVVNEGAATRSRVTSLALIFDAELDTALLAQPGAFVVRRLSDGATAGSVTASPAVAAGQTRVTLAFAGLNTESGSLADGRWVVDVNPAFVRTPAGVGLAASATTAAAHRFFGDGNGDGLVNNSDLFQFRLALNLPAAYRADFDHSADGLVNNSDLFQFRLRLNTPLP